MQNKKTIKIIEYILAGKYPDENKQLKIKKYFTLLDKKSFVNLMNSMVAALKINSNKWGAGQVFKIGKLLCEILEAGENFKELRMQLAGYKIDIYNQMLTALNHLGSPEMCIYLDKLETLLKRDYNALNIGKKIDAQIIFGHHKASYSENTYDFSESTVKYLNYLVKKIQDLTLLGKNDTELGELLSHIANIYVFCGDIGMAMFSFDLALKHYSRIPDERYRTTTYKLETYFEGQAHILLCGSTPHTKVVKKLLSEKKIRSFGGRLNIKYKLKELPCWCRDKQGKLDKYRLHLLMKMVAFDIYYSNKRDTEDKLHSDFIAFLVKFYARFLKKSQGLHPEVCIAKWLGVIYALTSDMTSAAKYFLMAENYLSTAPFTLKGFLPFLHIMKAAMFARNGAEQEMQAAVAETLVVWDDIKKLGAISKNYVKLYKGDFSLLKKKYKAGRLYEDFLWKTANRLPYYFN